MIDVDARPEPQEDPFIDMRKAKPWMDMLANASKTFAGYQQKCRNIEDQYAKLERMASTSGERQMRMFWANLEVMKPSIYARKPVPVVTPRFRKRDPLARASADVIERCIIASFDNEDINSVMKMVRDDLVMNGRGAMWLRHDIAEDTQIDVIKYEHVDREDFLHSPARKWDEVEWVAKRSWLTRERGVGRFGDAWYSVEMQDRKDPASEGSSDDKRGEVWEIWDKSKNAVVWVSPRQDPDSMVLDIMEPPLRLTTFWPCPKPAYSTCEPRTLRPVPDFLYYKDQIEEINELTARISALSEGLRMKGFYAAGNGDVATAIETAVKAVGNNAIMVPVPNFAGIGGSALKDSIVWLPVQEIAETITACVALRKQLIEDVYQITGISDIMRGSTDASETLGAQQLKSQYGNVRIRDRQEEMVRIALEVTEIAAEIMAENFSPEALKMYSQVDDLPSQADIQQQAMMIQQQIASAQQNPQIMALAQQNPEMAQQIMGQAQQQLQTLQNTVTWEAVTQMLRDEKLRPFVLDIETNSTIQPDEMADKQQRAEALTAIGGFLNQVAPLVQARPETGPFVSETLKWLAQGYRMGRAMDATIDEFADQIKAVAQQPKPPSPEQVQAEAESKKLEADMAMHKDEMDLKQADLALKAKEIDLKGKEMSMRAIDGMVSSTRQKSVDDREAANADREFERDEGEAQTLAGMASAIEKLTKMVEGLQQALKPTLN